ncbi:MAG: D-alanyl-D-alanine dipeptidase [Alphaproteobacteria bacterium]
MLTEITEHSHDVVLDLRYGTKNNFTSQQIYTRPRCLLHKNALDLLEKAIAKAALLGYRFKIFDAFRPQKAQVKLWECISDPRYVGPPQRGSPHTRGIAIDLTLIDKNNKELDMGTEFDAFEQLSHHGSAITNPEINHNRFILLGIMMSCGWDLLKYEWWHYQLFNATTYPLIEEDFGIVS